MQYFHSQSETKPSKKITDNNYYYDGEWSEKMKINIRVNPNYLKTHVQKHHKETLQSSEKAKVVEEWAIEC